MNKLTALLKHNYIVYNSIDEIKNVIDECNVVISGKGGYIKLTIGGDKEDNVLYDIFCDILNLFFICYGSFPIIQSIELNSRHIDVSNLIGKYTTDGEWFKTNYVIHEINGYIVNQDTVNLLRQKISKIPLSSFEYVLSEDYKHVLIPHKLSLLLYSVQGLVNDENAKESTKFRSFINAVCQRLYNVDKIEKCETVDYILQKEITYKNSKLFTQTLVDTRDWYSHFYYSPDDKEVLQKGNDMMPYLFIVSYMLRVYILKTVGVKVPDSTIAYYLKQVHDWTAVYVRKDKSTKLLTSLYSFDE